jgi:hypothetical protein
MEERPMYAPAVSRFRMKQVTARKKFRAKLAAL